MPARPSPSWRYLNARLQVLLRRPMMWGSGLVVFLAAVFLSEYWTNPQQFLGSGTSELPPDAAPEATLDPSLDPSLDPALDPTLDPAGSPSSALPDRLDPLISPATGESSDSALDSLLIPPMLGLPSESAQTDSATDRRSRRNSLSRSSSLTDEPDSINLSDPDSGSSSTLRFGTLDSDRSSSLVRPSSSSSSASSASASSTNPLQSALERSSGAGQPASLPNSSLTAPVAPTTGSSSQLPIGVSGQSSAPSSLPQSIPGQAPSYFPQTSPNPGTTGYTMPPAFRTPTNTPSQFGTYSGSSSAITPPTSPVPTAPVLTPPVAQPGFGSYSSPANSTPAAPTPNFNSGVQSPQAAPAVPFSAPRTPPGRTIGGGEINTFSNP